MVKIEKTASLSELSELKQAYFKQSTAALDGMWHFGFAPMANHYSFFLDNRLIGFCCINEEGYMLQFYLQPNFYKHGQQLFAKLIQPNNTIIENINGAFVSTAEAYYISLCLDNSTKFTVNALMYQHTMQLCDIQDKSANMQLVTQDKVAELVQFAVTNINAPKEWLLSYYSKLIKRNELFGYWQENELLAVGECRLFDDVQTDYAEVGMIVSESKRGQGIAKRVLNYLVKHAAIKNLTVICSTESDNISAQKAISEAGFTTSHRIVQFEFNDK